MAATTSTDEELASQIQGLNISHPSPPAEEDTQLIEDLIKLSKKNPKLVRSSDYQAPADPSIVVRSWKMNEFKYYDVPSPFPTLARGLFTQEVKDASGRSSRYRIVARGYDKFFNIGEVPWTNWTTLEKHTVPPYTLTLKSNGCIIFIAALTPTKLLVTSKHSLGPLSGKKESHAQVGERWLRKHLADARKTEEQLAATLWEKNWTAVAELCDDSFEEHVLPYGPDKTGLHLHGLNECTKQFKTMPQDAVDAFAHAWGFIPTASTVLDSVADVKAFTDQIGVQGKWNGEALEGFVVRTHVRGAQAPDDDGGGGSGSSRKMDYRDKRSAPPYAPGSSFFFKVKFDEPYMMYRDWREVTKTLLTKGASAGNVPKAKLRRPETKVYVRWVIEEIRRDLRPFEEYTRGKGIIATRERFLKWLETEEGRRAVESQDPPVSEEGLKEGGKKFGKTVIVPVAIPGVGKTSIAVALAHLFGFGHTQSDDIHAKKSAPIFIKNVTNLLKTHDVVIADKNNHLQQHRQQLRDAVKSTRPPVRLLALNWSFDQPLSTIHRICSDRVAQRGTNHQTLVADPSHAHAHEDVLWQFLNQAEELAEGEVDESVEMDVEENLEEALRRAVEGCVRVLGVQRPSEEQVGEGLAVARGYAPSSMAKAKAKTSGESKKTASSDPRYFGILAEVDLNSTLNSRFADGCDAPESVPVPESGKTFWAHLRSTKRIASRPHVTIVHSKSLPAEQALWDRCKELHALSSASPLFRFRLSHLVWNGRIMAAVVSDLAVSPSANGDGEEPDEKGDGFVRQLPAEVRKRLHITVGTRDKDVNPVEARDMVGEWKEKGDVDGVQSMELKDVWVKGRVKGLHS